MSRADARRIDELFAKALELEPGERQAFIASNCADAKARDRLEKLLAAAETDGDAFDERLLGLRARVLPEVIDTDDDSFGEDLTGQRIGVWRLCRKIARGGLATVYVANREDGEFDQTAAFKVLRRGLDTDDLVARFRAERQILSVLDHPSIAGILDGGALDDGRPYLVLEYIDGLPITDYCATNDVPLARRLELVQAVLDALHHAHRHLIVHRDIKPSNILVSAEGHVALLDFGIAKLLQPELLPGASTLTRTGVSLQTPGYSSPEQSAGKAVTTSSDVYQVGAVLYELLTGQRPRPVDNGRPVPPSRGAGTFREVPSVHRDLDAIVLKALHVDPDQRYASAADMRADIGRFLAGRQVLARPDTLRYRVSKFHERRPWAIPAFVVGVLAVAGYVYSLASLNERLRDEQRRTSTAQALMIDMLSSPDPFRSTDPDAGADMTVVEALDQALARVDDELNADPELGSAVLASIATVYANLDQHAEAINTREKALDLERELFGVPSEPVLASQQLLAAEYVAIDDYERATRYADEQLEAARSLHPRGGPALGVAEATSASIAAAIGDFAASEALYRQAIDRMRIDPAAHARTLLLALTALAEQLAYDDTETGLTLLDEAARLAAEHYGAESLAMAQVRSVRATVYSAAADYASAEAEFRTIIPIYESRLGRDHGETISTINNLGIMYNRQSKPELAEPVYREVLNRYLEKHGEVHRRTADGYQNLATAITRAGRYEEALPMHRKAYEIYQAVLPAEQPVVAYPLLSTAYAEHHLGNYANSERAAREAVAILERTGAQSFFVDTGKCLVARALQGQGDAEGDRLLRDTQERLRDAWISDTYRAFCGLSGEPMAD